MESSVSLYPALCLFAAFILGIPVFARTWGKSGRAHTSRIESAGGSILLSKFLMEYGYWFMSLPTQVLLRARVTPDFVTYLGLLVISLGSVGIGIGYFGLGGWILCFGSMLDAMDGMVARAQGTSSDRGEFLDAVIDRYAEIASFIGLIYYYNECWWALGLVLGALLGSLMVSYVRAKGEALGVNAPSGLMRRHERAVYLGAGCAMSPVVAAWLEPGNTHPDYHLALAAIAAIAILGNYSACKSIGYSLRALREKHGR